MNTEIASPNDTYSPSVSERHVDAPLLTFKDGNLLDAVISSSNDLIYVTDTIGRFLYVGETGARAVGQERVAMLGRTGREIGLPESIMDIADRVREEVISSRQSVYGKVVFPTVQGPRDMDYRYSPLLNDAGAVAAILGVARDVTEAVRIAQAQSDATNQLRLITDAAPLLISYIDRDFRYRFANQAYLDWFQQQNRERDILGRQVRDVIGEAAFETIRGYLEAALRGERVSYSAEMPYRDGGRRFVRTELAPDIANDGSGIVLGFVGVVHDITDRRDAELRMEESEARYRSLFEQNSDAVYSCDLSGRFVSANAACETISGFEIDELLSLSFLNLVVSEDQEPARQHFHQAAGGDPQTFQTAIRHKQGRRVDLTVTTFPIVIRGEIVGVYGIAQDKTAERDAQRRIEGMALAQRAFLRDVLASVSDGTFRLCDAEADLPAKLPLLAAMNGQEPLLLLEVSKLAALRRFIRQVAEKNGFSDERVSDLLTTVGEATMNAIVHGGGGTAAVYTSDDGSTIQVWVRDNGPGIATDYLHKATLQRGFSTGGIGFGHGFFLMNVADRVYLLTGSRGTTVVIEQERVQPEPIWYSGQ